MSLKHLQTKIGVTADGAFGPGTLKAAAAFYKMTPEREELLVNIFLEKH